MQEMKQNVLWLRETTMGGSENGDSSPRVGVESYGSECGTMANECRGGVSADTGEEGIADNDKVGGRLVIGGDRPEARSSRKGEAVGKAGSEIAGADAVVGPVMWENQTVQLRGECFQRHMQGTDPRPG